MRSWSQHRSLLRGLLAVFSWHLPLVLVLSLFLLVSWFIPTFAMNNFLQHLERRESQFAQAPATVEPLSIGYVWCLLVLLGALLRSCAEAHSWWWSKMIGNRTVTVLHMVIARALMDSANPPSNAVSLAAGDARKLGDAFNSGSSSFVLPFRAVVAIVYLGQLLGWAPVAVVVLVVCLVMPINMWIAQRMKKLQRESSKATDTRLDLSAQVIQAIRLIKTQVWETHYSSTIQAARTIELNLLARSMIWQALMMLLATFTPLFVTIAALGTYAFINSTGPGSGTLPPSTAFTAIQACYLLDYPMRIVPNMYAKVVLTGTISWNRVQEFLRAAYASPAANGSMGVEAMATAHRQVSTPGRVVLEGVKVQVSDQFALHVPGRLEFPKGKLTLVAGPIASGKTTLLLTLLGELLPVDGIVHFPPPSTTSYIEQTPFLLNTTLRDNVTFGLAYDPVRFAEIMHRCALTQDLAALPNGDLTILGDRGVTLSGGTRQRVALARALYPQHATTVIADDVLSAVDAVTASHLYKQALVPAARVEGKTVVLVSHAVELASAEANMVVVLKEGKVVAAGEPKQVLGDRAQWAVSQSTDSGIDQVQVVDQSPVIIAENKSAGERHEEERSQGSVKWAHYNTYARAFGMGLAIVTLFGLVAVQSLQLLADVYLKDWSSGMQNADSTTNSFYFLVIVAALKLGSSVVYGVVLLLCTFGSYVASRKLHEDMISHLLAFPLQWFTTNPASRVTNRLAKDLGIIDSALVADIKDFIVWLLINLFAVVAIAIASPVTLAVCTPLLAVYAWIGYVYVRASRDTRRMGNVAYSPVVQHLTELEAGGPCMRAFGQVGHFLGSTLGALREYVRPNLWNTGANRWFSIVGDSVISLLSFCVFLGFLILVAMNTSGDAQEANGLVPDRVSPWAALAINYLLMMIEGVRIVVAYWAFIEVEMSSVERVGEYLQLPTESCAGLTSVPEYPTAGPLVVCNVSVAYSKASQGDWNWVLRNVSMTVPAGKKVAIVGRTGSGKTSFFGALQRLVPHVQGEITLGGVPTSTLNLRYLRAQLGCVNQDNFLFSGTLRSNLDPTGALQDAEMHELLREFSSQLPFGLDHELTSATAVSKGQAQLIGLLRSLLAAKVKKTRLFLCDEPTSAIDHDTDAQFWHVFRHFHAVNQRAGAPVTVLMIAHRIRTLIDMDCDFVAVLDAGQIVEMGHPRDLLHRADGRFGQLTRESGTEVEALLQKYYG
ncbi:P-loop containing nucleoside triphosphate hydrolase protein [Catenaria anguillulae PL171]|uniref:p-loop containing nucleoside triphosphate hydrolase protein n=1 Tax=Catenaria anguillulae PL171 TaxID=765915 RepID=A0A1Y2HP52_9FUNG|nr:P-loop containing nucleoside triphosphate hydrolase protein [Catenaria anguillulae PL171]